MSYCVVRWKAKKRSEISKRVIEGHDEIVLGGGVSSSFYKCSSSVAFRVTRSSAGRQEIRQVVYT